MKAVNAQDNEGETVLVWAIRNGPDRTTDMIRLLLQHGAKVSFKDHNGKTALDLAEEFDYEDWLPLLKAALQKEQAEQKPSARTVTK